MSIRRKCRTHATASLCLFFLNGVTAPAQTVVLSVEVVPGQLVTGGSAVDVEVFMFNPGTSDLEIKYVDARLPCAVLSSSSGSGELRAQPSPSCSSFADCPAGTVCHSGGDQPFCLSARRFATSDARSGSVPSLFLDDGMTPEHAATCVLNMNAYQADALPILPAGERRYFGTVTYTVSPCAAGEFAIALEGAGIPCSNSDATQVRGPFDCVDVGVVPAGLSITLGRCCDENGACLADAMGRQCCVESANNALWLRSGDCTQTCACADDTDCDDGDPCNGAEICDEPGGLCTAGSPLACDDGLFCNGPEVCISGIGCVRGPEPCDIRDGCFESTDDCRPGIMLSVEPLYGAIAPAGSTIVLETFLTNLTSSDILITGYQIDFPCQFPASAGGAGEIVIQPLSLCQTNDDCPLNATCNPSSQACRSISIAQASDAGSGSIPWVFGSAPPNEALTPGYGLFAPFACRFAATRQVGAIPHTVPAGAKRYAGTVRARIDVCSGGTFTISPEEFTVPCTLFDERTAVYLVHFQCLNLEVVPAVITVPTVQCCIGGTCHLDTAGSACCIEEYSNGRWTPDRTCAEPCGCSSDSECDDGFYCNGDERCVDGQCTPGIPATCPPSPNPCVDSYCDAAADRCIGRPLLGGSPCNPASTCLTSGSCNASGICIGTPVLPGTPCEDGNPCTSADTCEHSGVCLSGTVTPCDDGLACNGLETCNRATGCVPGQPLCGPAETCDEMTDTCHPAVIPTVSTWGLVILALLLATAAKTQSTMGVRA